jgi:hypothetical protein
MNKHQISSKIEENCHWNIEPLKGDVSNFDVFEWHSEFLDER